MLTFHRIRFESVESPEEGDTLGSKSTEIEYLVCTANTCLFIGGSEPGATAVSYTPSTRVYSRVPEINGPLHHEDLLRWQEFEGRRIAAAGEVYSFEEATVERTIDSILNAETNDKEIQDTALSEQPGEEQLTAAVRDYIKGVLWQCWKVGLE
ncbi:MAG: hypothetical protein V1659_01350 [Candidatus Woesearchaeota archaeon]